MKLYDTLQNQLKKDPNYVTDDGKIKKWVVLNKAQNYDEELIGLLLDNAKLKEKFFVAVKDTFVFKQNLFSQFLEQKNYLNDSYTQYKNKVGLSIDGKYLKQRNEVVLVWPFKDCILEGGQSREEDKREEIFFNEILAQDEITQLLDPKALTNPKRITSGGEKLFDQFRRSENGTITDNLIIKGNNLLALHTLKEEFAGKVKLIYIDPPYNTGNDGFNYNDKFNHSTWMTFVYNRLKVAHLLLNNQGLICVQITDAELAYLKILLDEVFGRNNFIETVIWKKRNGPPNDKTIGSVHEYILLYAKSKPDVKLFLKPRNVEQLSRYKNPDNHPKGKWTSGDLMANVKGGRFVKSLSYPIVNPNTKEEHLPSSNGNWRFNKNDMQTLINNNEIYWGEDGKGRPKLKRFLNDVKAGVSFSTIWQDGYYSHTGTTELRNLFPIGNVFDTPKPEKLIEQIILLGSAKEDIILDYHLGSGTTCAVAHKMNRQYIGIEQMDYIQTVAVKRLKIVIDGDQGGISKEINWNGGGDFVYFELKKYNQTFIDQIGEAKDPLTLLQIWEQMKSKSFLNYNVDIKEQEKHIEKFKADSLVNQKALLLKLLDLNQLYVNRTSLNDQEYSITEEEKKVTNDFYRIK